MSIANAGIRIFLACAVAFFWFRELVNFNTRGETTALPVLLTAIISIVFVLLLLDYFYSIFSTSWRQSKTRRRLLLIASVAGVLLGVAGFFIAKVESSAFWLTIIAVIIASLAQIFLSKREVNVKVPT